MKILQDLHIFNPLSSLLQLLSFLKLLFVLALILLFIVPHHTLAKRISSSRWYAIKNFKGLIFCGF
jgi:hypothetical protein